MLLALAGSLVLAACAGGQSAGTAQATSAAQTTEAASTTAAESTAGAETSAAAEATSAAGLELTLEELAKYNGKDGNAAYIAVDGVIYDVSNSKAWENGGHQGYEAGQDLSEQIKSAPHGVGVLAGMPVVGVLVE